MSHFFLGWFRRVSGSGMAFGLGGERSGNAEKGSRAGVGGGREDRRLTQAPWNEDTTPRSLLRLVCI